MIISIVEYGSRYAEGVSEVGSSMICFLLSICSSLWELSRLWGWIWIFEMSEVMGGRLPSAMSLKESLAQGREVLSVYAADVNWNVKFPSNCADLNEGHPNVNMARKPHREKRSPKRIKRNPQSRDIVELCCIVPLTRLQGLQPLREGQENLGLESWHSTFGASEREKLLSQGSIQTRLFWHGYSCCPAEVLSSWWYDNFCRNLTIHWMQVWLRHCGPLVRGSKVNRGNHTCLRWCRSSSRERDIILINERTAGHVEQKNITGTLRCDCGRFIGPPSMRNTAVNCVTQWVRLECTHLCSQAKIHNRIPG